MNNAMPDIERNLEFVPVHNDRARSLSPAQIRQYNDDGFIFASMSIPPARHRPIATTLAS
jgi:hypothetical protein